MIKDRYAGPWHQRTAQTVLVFGNYYDPATRYVFSQRMAHELGNARLVSTNAIGHTILGLSGCVDEITTHYLLDGMVPPAGVVCQPDKPPF